MNFEIINKLNLPIFLIILWNFFTLSNSHRIERDDYDSQNYYDTESHSFGIEPRKTSIGNCHPWANWVGLCWTGCERFQHYDNGGKSCDELYPDIYGIGACRCWFWTPLGDPNPQSDASHWVCGRTILEGTHPNGLDWIIEDCKTLEYGY